MHPSKLFMTPQSRYSGVRPAKSTFLGGFCLQVFRQAGPPQGVDCLAPMGSKRKSVFPKNSTTHCQFENGIRGKQPFRSLSRRCTIELSPPLNIFNQINRIRMAAKNLFNKSKLFSSMLVSFSLRVCFWSTKNKESMQ